MVQRNRAVPGGELHWYLLSRFFVQYLTPKGLCGGEGRNVGFYKGNRKPDKDLKRVLYIINKG